MVAKSQESKGNERKRFHVNVRFTDQPTPNMATLVKGPLRKKLNLTEPEEDEVRRKQISAAIYPTEEPVLREICARLGTNASHLFREILAELGRQHGIIPKPPS